MLETLSSLDNNPPSWFISLEKNMLIVEKKCANRKNNDKIQCIPTWKDILSKFIYSGKVKHLLQIKN